MNIHFLLGIPRAGNTLFGSLMNQNHNVKMTANSALPLIINNILQTKEHSLYWNFPDPRGIDNIIQNIFKNYYEPLNVNHVLDRGAWGLPYLSNITKQLVKDRKYVILYRPILECLASFAKIDKPKDVHKYCDEHMQHSIISQNLESVRNICNSNEKFKVVYYEDLCKDPIAQIKDTCNFLDIPYIEPDLFNIKQFSVDGYKYSDNTFHPIRTHEVKKEQLHIEDYLSIDIIDKYKDYEVKFND
jgi:hypothetical protein|tara:strand:- start:3540 stop:4271 length:732 start_codon:yes stop_codon:yes gene_type:complete